MSFWPVQSSEWPVTQPNQFSHISLSYETALLECSTNLLMPDTFSTHLTLSLTPITHVFAKCVGE